MAAAVPIMVLAALAVSPVTVPVVIAMKIAVVIPMVISAIIIMVIIAMERMAPIRPMTKPEIQSGRSHYDRRFSIRVTVRLSVAIRCGIIVAGRGGVDVSRRRCHVRGRCHHHGRRGKGDPDVKTNAGLRDCNSPENYGGE